MEDMSKSMLAQLRSTLEDALQASGIVLSVLYPSMIQNRIGGKKERIYKHLITTDALD